MKNKTYKKYIVAGIILSFTFSNVTLAADENTNSFSSFFSLKIINPIKNLFISEQKEEITVVENIQVLKEDVLIKSVNKTLQASKCLNIDKINIKKNKLTDQIKNQISDKNKLVDNLLSISSSTEDIDLKTKIDDNILKLESDISNVIEEEKNLIKLLNLSNDYSCNKTLTKTQKTNETKIKDLEIQINKNTSDINNFIKIDLKDLLGDIE